MTKLLEQAIAEVRKLSDEEQDRIATELMTYLTDLSDGRGIQLSEEQVAEVRRRLAEADPKYLTWEEAEARLRRLGA